MRQMEEMVSIRLWALVRRWVLGASLVAETLDWSRLLRQKLYTCRCQEAGGSREIPTQTHLRCVISPSWCFWLQSFLEPWVQKAFFVVTLLDFVSSAGSCTWGFSSPSLSNRTAVPTSFRSNAPLLGTVSSGKMWKEDSKWVHLLLVSEARRHSKLFQ